jgi:CRISPR-associated protein Cmr4
LPDTDAHHFSRDNETTALREGDHIYLEDLDFVARPCQAATDWAQRIAAWVFPDDTAWQKQFKRRFLIVPDCAFDFLCNTGTEVHTRVRIHEDTKTVAKGALWTEESLPAETLLMGLVHCDRGVGRNGTDVQPQGLLDDFAKVKDPLILQIGGKATVGRGQVRCVFSMTGGAT